MSHSHKHSTRRPKTESASSGKLKLSLTALSSAAVLAIYSAGFMRTRAAAEKFAADESIPNRPSGPVVPGASIARSGGPGPSLTPAAPVPATIAPVPATSSTPSMPRPAETAATPAPAPAPTAPASKVLSPEPKAEPLVASNTVAGTDTVVAPAPAPLEPAPAAAAPAAPAPPTTPLKPKYNDGSYTGWGTSRHGDIEAKVTIVDGKIQAAVINQCWTQYSCSWIAPLPPQVAQRQSAEVDYVSGGTQSTFAFYYAVIEALKKAK